MVSADLSRRYESSDVSVQLARCHRLRSGATLPVMILALSEARRRCRTFDGEIPMFTARGKVSSKLLGASVHMHPVERGVR